ncbi:MAG: hypothetical protein R3B70_13720 [Polyangiaceae bacterium]
MKSRTLLLAVTTLFALAAASGCDDGGNNTGGAGGTGGNTGGVGGSTAGAGGSTGGTGGTGGSFPPAPKLGAQIDRMGRPAINTALNHTFDNNPEQADQAKDGYNAAGKAMWSSYVSEIQTNLAILDSLDTDCGNQLLADAAKNDPSRYATLAGALADDRLYVNADGGACTTYLAVEADATGILANTDCGGRRLAYDVIDISYSVLAAGALSGVGDDVDVSTAAKGEVFPHLAAPQ